MDTVTPFTGLRRPFRNSDATLRKILATTDIVVMIGASDKSDRPSNEVMQILLDYGYRVIPINPRLKGQQLMGETVLGSLEELPDVLERSRSLDSHTSVPASRKVAVATGRNVMVDIFRRSESVGDLVDQAIALGRDFVSSIWMQIGVIDESAARKAREAGLNVAMNVCPAEEIPRLRIRTPAIMGRKTEVQLGQTKGSTRRRRISCQENSTTKDKSNSKRRKYM